MVGCATARASSRQIHWFIISHERHAVKEPRFQFSARSLAIILFVAAVGAAVAARFSWLWMECLAAVAVVACLIIIVSHPQPLRFYLKYVNPLLAVVVLAICVFAGSTENENNQLVYVGWFKDQIQSYFLAKGIFCAVAIFLLGKLVEIMSGRNFSP